LAVFNKFDAVQTSLFLLKRTVSITPLTTLCTRQSNTFPPTCGRIPMTLPAATRICVIIKPRCPLHHPNYVDYSGHQRTSGRPMDYHPVAESSSTKINGTGTHKIPITRAYTQSPLSQLISTHTHTNSSRRRQPRCFAKPSYRPTNRVVPEPSLGLSTQCTSHRSGIEPRHSCPFPGLPSDGTWKLIVPSQHNTHLCHPPRSPIQTQRCRLKEPMLSIRTPPTVHPRLSVMAHPQRPHNLKRCYESQHTTIEYISSTVERLRASGLVEAALGRAL